MDTKSKEWDQSACDTSCPLRHDCPCTNGGSFSEHFPNPPCTMFATPQEALDAIDKIEKR